MTTFTGVTGRALVRALQSLTDSTCLTITVRQVEYHATGLCSPYLSHQHVRVTPSAGLSDSGVTLKNERFAIHAVTLRDYPALDQPSVPEGHERHTALVPTSAILAVCERLARIVPGLAGELRSQINTALVAVSILMPRVVGFDDDGAPVFAPTDTEADTEDPLAGITEASFSPDDEPPAPADDDPEPGGEEG